MAVEQTTTRPRLSLAKFRELWPLILKITGFCLLVWGSSLSLIGAFGLNAIDLSPPGGGWRAVIDAGIKGALAGGSLPFLGALLAFSGVSIYNRGRKMTLSSIRETLRPDPAPPVLYLRSFRDDPVTAQPTSIPPGIVIPTTQEEQVVHVLNGAGPVLAVGQPSEVLPELGATRLQFSGHEWKDEVSRLMKHSILTVIRLGTSGGLLWEIETAVSQTRPQQLILLIPFDQTEYERLAKEVGHLFPCGLPSWPSDHQGKPAERATNRGLDVKAVVYFDSTWRGIMVPLPANVRLGASFDKAMQCIYPELNIEPKRPSLLRSWVRIALAIVGLIAAFIPGLMVLSKSQIILQRLYKNVYALHIVSKTRVQQLAESSDPFLQAISSEIAKNTRVRAWFESVSDEDLSEMSSRVAQGLPSLDDELLYERERIISDVLNAVDTLTCATLIRSISSARSISGERAQGLENFTSNGSSDLLLKLIETHLGSTGERQFASILVKAVEASLTNAPTRLPTQQQYERAVADTLDLLSAQDRERMIRAEQNYTALSDEDLCWVERMLHTVQLQLRPSSHSAMIRGPLGIKR